MAFRDISRCPADADGVNDCSCMNLRCELHLCFLIYSLLFPSLHCALWIDQGPPLQRMFQSVKCSSEEMRGKGRGDFQRTLKRRYTVVSGAVRMFFFFFLLDSNTTEWMKSVHSFTGHYSSTDWTVKGVWKAGVDSAGLQDCDCIKLSIGTR